MYVCTHLNVVSADTPCPVCVEGRGKDELLKEVRRFYTQRKKEVDVFEAAKEAEELFFALINSHH